MQFKTLSNLIAELSLHTTWHVTRHVASDKCLMCCMWFAHDCIQATWAYVLETVRGAVRRLYKISNCTFEYDYYYFYDTLLNVPQKQQQSLSQTFDLMPRCCPCCVLCGPNDICVKLTNGCNLPPCTHTNTLPLTDLNIHNFTEL